MKLLPVTANSITNWKLMVQSKLTLSEGFVPPLGTACGHVTVVEEDLNAAVEMFHEGKI